MHDLLPGLRLEVECLLSLLQSRTDPNTDTLRSGEEVILKTGTVSVELYLAQSYLHPWERLNPRHPPHQNRKRLDHVGFHQPTDII